MMDSFVPEYVESLPYGIGKVIRKEFFRDTACDKIFKNLHKLKEDNQECMVLDERVCEMQKTNLKMIEAGINIKTALAADKAKTVDMLSNDCGKVLLIFFYWMVSMAPIIENIKYHIIYHKQKGAVCV